MFFLMNTITELLQNNKRLEYTEFSCISAVVLISRKIQIDMVFKSSLSDTAAKVPQCRHV